MFAACPRGPDELARQMNRLCIAMTHAKRRKDAKRERKALLRQMKPFLRRIGAHAARHRDKLEAKRPRTRFSQKEAAGIIARVDKMLRQIDPVIEQAHERLIGERAVPTKKKILSVHEPDVQVIVRGKAGKAVEFGNTLLLSENRDGYLTDWMLYRESAPSEPKQLKESLARQNAYDLDKPVEAVSTDRGFASKATCRLLEGGKVYDATCPRDPATLAQAHGRKALCGSATPARVDGGPGSHPRQLVFRAAVCARRVLATVRGRSPTRSWRTICGCLRGDWRPCGRRTRREREEQHDCETINHYQEEFPEKRSEKG